MPSRVFYIEEASIFILYRTYTENLNTIIILFYTYTHACARTHIAEDGSTMINNVV